MKEIQKAIQSGDYEKADTLLQEYLKKGAEYDDVTAVLDVNIGEYYGDRERIWNAIRKGLLFNCRNHELYVMLGNYYLSENLDQAYLCYENALFYCCNDEDRKLLTQLLEQLKEEQQVAVNRTSIVILSCNSLEYTRFCIESIRTTTLESGREIVVVDNASEDGSVEWLREQTDIILIENKENKGFPAGCNQGIQACSPETDIFLLNSDAALPVNALFWLRMGLYESRENGMAGSVSNYARDQEAEGVEHVKNADELFTFAEKINVPMKYSGESKLSLIGFALLVRRNVVDQVGLLDERFSPGNYEDNDYSLRVLTAGYRNILCKNSFILHFGNVSFKNNSLDLLDIRARNLRKLNEKWGFDVAYYVYPRRELIQLIEEETDMPLHILDIGCGCGAMMGCVKGIYPKAKVYGIEKVSKAAGIASHMGEVICGDVEQVEFPWEEAYFDYIMMGDVLEHLMNPDRVLERLEKHLKPGGHIIVSMPNVKHYSVLLPLLRQDRFSYEDAGILDRTHVKLYTGTEIQRLILRCGYEIETIDLIGDRRPDEEEEKLIDGLCSLLEISDKNSFLTYQYIVKARKQSKTPL